MVSDNWVGCAQYDDTNGNMTCLMVVDGSDDDDDGDDDEDGGDGGGGGDESSDANDIFYYTDFNEYDQADNLRFLVSDAESWPMTRIDC